MLFAIDKYYSQLPKLDYKKITISEAEIKKFYDDYKWAFSLYESYSDFDANRSFIYNEIKRLKYYRLDELLTNPPKVELNTK